VVLDGGGLSQRIFGRFLVRFGFFGEVGFGEELGDLLFLGGEGAGSVMRWNCSGVRAE
jgi:hypothetical protein